MWWPQGHRGQRGARAQRWPVALPQAPLTAMASGAVPIVASTAAPSWSGCDGLRHYPNNGLWPSSKMARGAALTGRRRWRWRVKCRPGLVPLDWRVKRQPAKQALPALSDPSPACQAPRWRAMRRPGPALTSPACATLYGPRAGCASKRPCSRRCPLFSLASRPASFKRREGKFIVLILARASLKPHFPLLYSLSCIPSESPPPLAPTRHEWAFPPSRHESPLSLLSIHIASFQHSVLRLNKVAFYLAAPGLDTQDPSHCGGPYYSIRGNLDMVGRFFCRLPGKERYLLARKRAWGRSWTRTMPARPSPRLPHTHTPVVDRGLVWSGRTHIQMVSTETWTMPPWVSQYLGTFGSTCWDHASIPPEMFVILLHPFVLRYLTTCMLLTP